MSTELNPRRSLKLLIGLIFLSGLHSPAIASIQINSACEKYRAACQSKTYKGLFGRHAVSTCIWAAARKNKDLACLTPARKTIEAMRTRTPRYTWQK